jgi:hypothetical protein
VTFLDARNTVPHGILRVSRNCAWDGVLRGEDIELAAELERSRNPSFLVGANLVFALVQPLEIQPEAQQMLEPQSRANTRNTVQHAFS